MWLSCSLGPSCLSCLLTLDLNSEAPQHNRVACFFLMSRSCCFQTWCDLLPGARQRALDSGGSGGRRPVPRWVRHVWEERAQCGWLPSGLMRRQALWVGAHLQQSWSTPGSALGLCCVRRLPGTSSRAARYTLFPPVLTEEEPLATRGRGNLNSL